MNICIVSYMYPNKYSSSDQVFVKMLVDEFAQQGHKCVVVCPFNTLHYQHVSKGNYSYSVGTNEVRVVCPNYISASNISFGSFNVSEFLHKHAINRALRNMEFIPDIIYCHFWKQGLKAYPFARKNQIPLFVASGECEILVDNKTGDISDFTDYVKGVICVSTKNKDESVEKKLTLPEKCYVVPNSINDKLFRVMDKEKCRADLGLPKGKFIIAFVGWFANRKGSKRVSDAISRIDKNDVYSLFIGSGSDLPKCNNVLFIGKVNHDILPKYLNAADVFVLPTLQEGCCNAVIEAMACGLPIISSNLPFNWDVLNERNSILIDPMNIDEIQKAIITLRDDARLRKEMSNFSLESAKELTISERARKIINFIESQISS